MLNITISGDCKFPYSLNFGESQLLGFWCPEHAIRTLTVLTSDSAMTNAMSTRDAAVLDHRAYEVARQERQFDYQVVQHFHS